ncbi:interleukin-18-like [Cololabis saira]|uniref:interleukin-18-like n=1 Tax=Cololabis saira TaxID=129043 RepID=UPI002AD57DDA|nr:interleukin-18-like [Cololabis saira]
MIHDASCAFQVEDLDSVERQNPDCRFHIQPYKDSSHNQGNPVMLYVQKNDEKIMVCCRNDREVCAKKMEPPKNIQDEGHEALFYQTDVCGDMYKFKSTKYKGSFLGFDYDENDLYKLVLLKPAVDEVDERCHIIQPLV